MHGHRYRVKSGDSLSSIARAQLGKAHYWPRIFSYNNRTDVVAVTGRALADPDRLSIGQLLLLPPPEQVHGHVSHIADQRHPQQATTPRIVPSTAPAQAAAPPASSAPPAPKGAAGRSFTTINSYPFKFKLDQIPKQTLEYPLFTATLKFDGTLVIWVDKQITTGAITNKGYEASAKQTAAGVLADLVQDAKIGWEPGSKKASFEDMLTLNAHGAPPSLTSVGIAMDSENAMPAMRFKFQSPKLQGKFRQHLYTAVNFTLTADLRPKKPDSGTRGPVPVPVPVPAPQRQPEAQPWYARAGHWVADHKVEIGVGIVVTAVIASNFITAGADTEMDPAAALWAERTLEAARLARSAAPAFAH